MKRTRSLLIDMIGSFSHSVYSHSEHVEDSIAEFFRRVCRFAVKHVIGHDHGEIRGVVGDVLTARTIQPSFRPNESDEVGPSRNGIPLDAMFKFFAATVNEPIRPVPHTRA